MFRKVNCVACMVGVVALALCAGSLQADMVYNANTEMVAKMTSATPAAVFGTWSLGWRSATDGASSTAFTQFVTYLDWSSVGVRGYGRDAGGTPDVAVNYTGAPIAQYSMGTDEMHFATGPDTASFAVLRWTAPEAGTVDISAIFRGFGGGTKEAAVVHNGVSLYDSTFSGAMSKDGSQSGVSVLLSDTIDVIVGNGNSTPLYTDGDATGVYCSISYIPEPSTLVLLITGLVGLLAYAWRKQK